ncbi:MAG: hypothetical protein H7320_12040 [Ferruginibacter sp.]|nr:hypothetical protein [Ferruginibacter sp.]
MQKLFYFGYYITEQDYYKPAIFNAAIIDEYPFLEDNDIKVCLLFAVKKMIN